MRTPWTPWTPSHSVKKYFKNDDHDCQQWNKDLFKKKFVFLE